VSHVGSESGFTMVELLVTMAILATVMGGLTSMFASGLKGEADLDRRFRAQQQLGLALDRMKREIHFACDQTATAIVGPASTVTIDMAGGTPASCATPTQVTWCVRLISTARYGLYRVAGATCTGGTLLADYITSATPFTLYPFNMTASSSPSLCNCYALARLRVDLTVQTTAGRAGVYRRVTEIAFRNSRQ
jgi:prepilin-type N-terminal cleavage/methylation domain-containing protein